MVFNTCLKYVVSDSSPMIRYSGEWNIVLNDTYTQGRYHSTNDNSANATLDFYGSSVRVFGPMKPNNVRRTFFV